MDRANSSSPEQSVSDREFVAQLRVATANYLAAVDAWETAYRKFYRLAEPARKVSKDLEEPQRQYDKARRVLVGMVPRARGLCYRYELKDPWTGLIRTTLEQHAPQNRVDSALSRGERQQVNESLILLAEACTEFTSSPPGEDVPRFEGPAKRSLLRRLLDFFY